MNRPQSPISLILSLLLLLPNAVYADTASTAAVQKMQVIETPSTNVDFSGSVATQSAQAAAGKTVKPQAAEITNVSGDWTINSETGSQAVTIIAGKSHVMRFNRSISRIAISNPGIADVVMVDAGEVLINTKIKGAANLIVWDLNNNIYTYNLNVTGDPQPLKNALKSIDPGNPLEVFPTEKGFVVKGDVQTVEKQNQISNTAKAFSEDSVSIVTVNEAKQILLEIRFVEISRANGLEFGIDLSSAGKTTGATFLPGNTEFSGSSGTDDQNIPLSTGAGTISTPDSPFSFPHLKSPSDGWNTMFTAVYQSNSKTYEAVIKALEDKSLTKILARPNLLVKDSEEASFLVGGEFPVPVTTNDTINIEYKEYGTRLKYKPQILNDNMIRLTVDTEVSQLDFTNGVTINSITIPALISRKTTSVVELKSGSTLAIGGLIQKRETQIESGVPGLRKIPLIGKLFESTNNDITEVELMVVITPHIVDPKLDAVDLNNIPIDHPLHTALEAENPPFEENRALAMEKFMDDRFSKNRTAKDVAEDRALVRNNLYRTMVENKKQKRDEDFYRLVNEVVYDGKQVHKQPEKK